MDNAPISSDVGRRAGVPWHYPLVFLLNLTVILVLELLLVYKYPIPLTETILAERNPAYANAVIQNSTDSNTIIWYLVETEDKEIHLLPTLRHAVFHNHCRIYDDQTVIIPPDTTEMEVLTRHGISGTTVLVGTEVQPQEGEEPAEGALQMRPKYYNNTGKYTFGFYFFMALAMSIVEFIIWNKIKGSL